MCTPQKIQKQTIAKILHNTSYCHVFLHNRWPATENYWVYNNICWGEKKQKQHKTVQTNSEGSRVNHQVYQ